MCGKSTLCRQIHINPFLRTDYSLFSPLRHPHTASLHRITRPDEVEQNQVLSYSITKTLHLYRMQVAGTTLNQSSMSWPSSSSDSPISFYTAPSTHVMMPTGSTKLVRLPSFIVDIYPDTSFQTPSEFLHTFAKPRGFLAHRILRGAAPQFLAKMPLYITGHLPSRRLTFQSADLGSDVTSLEAFRTSLPSLKGFLQHRMENRGISGTHLLNMPMCMSKVHGVPPPMLSLSQKIGLGFLEHRMAIGASRKFLCSVPDRIIIPGQHPLRIQGKQVSRMPMADELTAYPLKNYLDVPRQMMGALPEACPPRPGTPALPLPAKKMRYTTSPSKALLRVPPYFVGALPEPLPPMSYLPLPASMDMIPDPEKCPSVFTGEFFLRPPPAKQGFAS